MQNLFARAKNKLNRYLGTQTSTQSRANKNTPLPPAVEKYLTIDNKDLLNLERRYSDSGLPMAAHSWWAEERTSSDLEIAWFRGDNAYVWQTRHMGQDPAVRYYLYAKDILSRDRHNWLWSLKEDGAFGCWVFEYETLPPLSRDLLDSVNELSFLDEHLNIFGGSIKSILDIGAGYGRLAHRGLTAFPKLEHYYCADGVATSSFICDYYLGYRQLKPKAKVIPLDKIDDFEGSGVDLVVNVHSFSEMTFTAIEGWFERLQRWSIPYLFIVPNHPTSFRTIEKNDDSRDFLTLIEKSGYREIARQPAIVNSDIRKFVGVNDHFFLFSRI